MGSVIVTAILVVAWALALWSRAYWKRRLVEELRARGDYPHFDLYQPDDTGLWALAGNSCGLSDDLWDKRWTSPAAARREIVRALKRSGYDTIAVPKAADLIYRLN